MTTNERKLTPSQILEATFYEFGSEWCGDDVEKISSLKELPNIDTAGLWMQFCVPNRGSTHLAVYRRSECRNGPGRVCFTLIENLNGFHLQSEQFSCQLEYYSLPVPATVEEQLLNAMKDSMVAKMPMDDQY